MKQKQVMHFVDLGKEYSVIKVYGAKANPYRIYHHYNTIDENGFLRKHRVCVEKYGNMESCFYWFIQNGIGR